jgi:flagella basal body P-ring formation protein FlgA
MRKTFKSKKTISALLAAALLMTTPGQAVFAAATPKNSVVLSGGSLTVGDVFDDAGDAAGHYLAPAPAYGKTMTLTSQDLLRISNAFNLGWFPAGVARAITVSRDAREIDKYQIQAALQEKLAADMQGRQFDVELNTDVSGFFLPSGVESSVEVKDLKYDVSKNDFRALVIAPAGSEDPVLKREISGRLYALSSVPVLNKALRAGDVISASDVQYVDMRAGDISTSMVVSAEKLIGQTPRRGISAMKPVSASEVTQPVAVKKGEMVTMTLQNNMIQLTAQGRALQDGATGEVVRVINTSSNQIVEAIVTAERTVAVTPPSAALENGKVAGNF